MVISTPPYHLTLFTSFFQIIPLPPIISFSLYLFIFCDPLSITRIAMLWNVASFLLRLCLVHPTKVNMPETYY